MSHMYDYNVTNKQILVVLRMLHFISNIANYYIRRLVTVRVATLNGLFGQFCSPTWQVVIVYPLYFIVVCSLG